MNKHYVTATYKSEQVFVSDLGLGGLLNLSFAPVPVTPDEARSLLARALRDESLTDQRIETSI